MHSADVSANPTWETTAAPSVAGKSAGPGGTAVLRRIAGLDGIRGLAALFVVMNHIFLRAWPGYPADHAPF